MRPLLRPPIERITEYTLEHRECRIKLNQNENPFDLPDEVRNEVLSRVAAVHWSRYPEFVPRRQMEKIAEFTGWTADGVLLGNGSNDLLQLLFTCALDAGRGVVISQPTFTLYKLLAEAVGAPVCEVPMTRSFTVDTGAVIAAANERGAAMLVLCSPNNPTGGQIPLADLESILGATGALVVVDEAYCEFVDKEDYPDVFQGHGGRGPPVRVCVAFSASGASAGQSEAPVFSQHIHAHCRRGVRREVGHPEILDRRTCC